MASKRQLLVTMHYIYFKEGPLCRHEVHRTPVCNEAERFEKGGLEVPFSWPLKAMKAMN